MKKIITRKISLLALIFAMLPVLLIAQKINKTYSDVHSIDISLEKGDLIIKKGTSNKVIVKGEYDEEEMEVSVEYGSGFIKIKEKNRHRKNNNIDKSIWTLTIPDGLDIVTNVGMGDLEMAGLKVDLDANVGMGDCDLFAVEGKIKVNMGMGNIDVENSKGKFDLNAGMKNIKIKNSEGKITANSGMGDVVLKGTKVTGNISLNSGMGNVKLELSGEIMADIELNTGMGNAILDFNGNKISGDFEMRCGIKGGEIIAPFDFEKVRTVGQRNNGHIEKMTRIGNSDHFIEISVGKGKATVKS